MKLAALLFVSLVQGLAHSQVLTGGLSWRDTGSPSRAGPPSPQGPDGAPTHARMRARASRPGSEGAPGGLRPGSPKTQMTMMMQSLRLAPPVNDNKRSPDTRGPPSHSRAPGTPRYLRPGPPGAPLSMMMEESGGPHPPGIRGPGWRPGPPIELAEMRMAPDPEEKVKNLTIDQVIVKAYGSINKTLEEPEDRENQDKVLVELDMMLTPQQYRDLYGVDPPSHLRQSRDGSPSAPGSRTPTLRRANNDHRHRREHDTAPAPPAGLRGNLGPSPPGYHGNKRRRFRRKAPVDNNLRWTDNVVPYEMVYGDFTPQERAGIRAAMDQLESDSCVRFVKAEPWQYNRIRLQHGNGCNSAIGMVGGTQLVNLDETGCRFRGLYLHELSHALGRVHEHQLPDRDNHIRIIESNVLPEIRQWFRPYTDQALSYFGEQYDITSIMHYGETAFSKDGVSKTLHPIDPRNRGKIGQVFKRKQQSFVDKKVLNAMYNCSGRCDRSVRCSNGGFLNQFCSCECPDGSHRCQMSGTVIQDPRRSCVNTEPDAQCDQWTADGECYLNPVWMEDNCKKSCGKCAPLAPPEVRCEDKETRCAAWAADGECQANSLWMMHHCPKSCKRCQTAEDCEDTYEEKRMCEYWASGGECFKNPTWMVDNCKKSCNRCPKKNKCYNANADEDECYNWARSGECTANPTWMGEQCRKACGLCEEPATVTEDGDICTNRYGERKCTRWAKEDECTKNPQWMIDNCRKACTRCDVKSRPKPTVPAPTTPREVDEEIIPDEEDYYGQPEEPSEAEDDDDDDDKVDPDCYNAFKSDQKCVQWAKEEECTANPAWMEANCKKACKLCKKDVEKTCLNKYVSDPMCDQWAETGECEANASWMMKQCRMSCIRCDGYRPKEKVCENEYVHDIECVDWAETGECQANKAWMMINCYKACSGCKPRNGTREKAVKCIDINPSEAECISWQTDGQCETNEAFMMINCYKTCTDCNPRDDPPEVCMNLFPMDDKCDEKARLGGCMSNRAWMIENCYKSCSECDGVRRGRVTEDRTCININGDKDCNKWSRDGECVSNRYWMKTNCKKACTDCAGGGPVTTIAPEECTNEYGNDRECGEWADDGECQYNKEWMMFYCKKSCLKCDGGSETRPNRPPKPCRNKHHTRADCVRWYNDGECEFNHYWMLDNCYEVCTGCTPDDTRPDPVWPDQPVRPTTTTTTTTPTTAPPTEPPTPPPWSRCRDKHPLPAECRIWKNDGQCDKNPGYMLKNCQWTCGACDHVFEEEVEESPTCYDAEESCAGWAENGQCEISPGYMFLECQRSCGLCDRGCVDQHSLCSRWAAHRGYCVQNAGFMYPNCPRSCKICTV